ncbi:MAG: DUF2330 domain-containing protein [Leptospirales bacterium]|nr:DUF2330 domain-containing protein [Leptospirales bacterium]
MAAAVALALAGLIYSPEIAAFCGFYVGRADARLFNRASRVVLARSGDRTVLTMASDFEGPLTEFALVTPVPVVLRRDQIHVGESAALDRIDAFTAPRLVEYFDGNPCETISYHDVVRSQNAEGVGGGNRVQPTAGQGVRIEARYTVGEYDILILSAEDSGGLLSWLSQNGYRLPPGAEPVLQSYIRQNLRFFVARVNLEEQSRTGYRYLRPIQIAFESPRFMLPVRLGTVNANGAQELFVYALSPRGRIESVNYRTARIPSDAQVPEYIKDEFANFYRDMFTRSAEREGLSAIFLEYAWDMGWCDPCAADPLSASELLQLGAFWAGTPGAASTFVTRMHIRYTGESFPSDIVFQETSDRGNFQGRYIMRHAYNGPAECAAGKEYRRSLPARHEQEAQSLAALTGWSIDSIRARMGQNGPPPERAWWQRVFQD